MARLDGDVWPFLEVDSAVELVREYFNSGDYTGGSFEKLAGGGDSEERRNHFDATDLVAITMLGVSVPGGTALRILGDESGTFSDLLGEIPHDVDLWDASESLVAPDSPTHELWSRLVGLPGIRWVKAGKLLARKRPRLIPVYDSVVKAALMPTKKVFWLPLHAELQNPALIERLREIRDTADVGDDISLLRVLDVAIWMRNLGITQVEKEREGIRPIAFTPNPRG